jgi:Arc/MetJ family transcription regulator
MQTTITIDDNLLQEAAKLANTDNQSQLIELALSEFIQHHQPTKQRDVRDIVGKVSIDPDYDYKKMRTGEL